MNNELLLFDRLEVIKTTLKEKINDCYVSFSGGKDRVVLSALIDLALPNNNIPRVFINTGIEYLKIVEFVKKEQEKDKRIVVINPTMSIKKVLETYGYPFKSKEHSCKIGQWQKGSKAKSIVDYRDKEHFGCPKILKYQFDKDFKIKLSDKCCYKLKKEPIKKWAKENNKTISILGLRLGEHGQRENHKGCVVFNKNGSIRVFKPMNPMSEEWEDWFIEKYKIQLCDLYYPPFNFKRTGCKGCPYNVNLKEQLEKMAMFLPSEKKQCEIIWQPIYEEYKRIGYRLKV